LIYTGHRYITEGVNEVREPTFLVLVALADGRRHGYGIIQDVERLSNGKTTLRAGTLYATLDRLDSEGLIEGAGEEIVDGRLRRYYCLTGPGSAVLESESKQRLTVSKEALRRLRVAGGRPRLAGGFA
jgi:DNA-binding PadR family transcriptional regulator